MIASHITPAGTRLLPKYWRPKLPDSAKLDVQLIHWDLFQRFTDGTATETELWDWIETGFTYSEMARLLLADGVPVSPEAAEAIAEQLRIYPSVVERFKRTGRLGYSGTEYWIARAAVQSMDALIHLDRHGIGLQAATASPVLLRAFRVQHA